MIVRYIALGDSISIDLYPARETGRTGLGAASLFHQNDDAFWPEFKQRDLISRFGDINVVDLTADGATTDDVLRWQLPRVSRSDDDAIVTLTAGGNDMLMNLGSRRVPANLAEKITGRLERIIDRISELLPNSRTLFGTVYDPSDGTNTMNRKRFDREAEWLSRVNDGIRRIARDRDRVLLADIHRHFLGHGLTAPERERWYWSGLIFEPGARGASEVRRLWLECVGI